MSYMPHVLLKLLFKILKLFCHLKRFHNSDTNSCLKFVLYCLLVYGYLGVQENNAQSGDFNGILHCKNLLSSPLCVCQLQIQISKDSPHIFSVGINIAKLPSGKVLHIAMCRYY